MTLVSIILAPNSRHAPDIVNTWKLNSFSFVSIFHKLITVTIINFIFMDDGRSKKNNPQHLFPGFWSSLNKFVPVV